MAGKSTLCRPKKLKNFNFLKKYEKFKDFHKNHRVTPGALYDDLRIQIHHWRYVEASPRLPLHLWVIFGVIRKHFGSIWWQENQLCVDKKNWKNSIFWKNMKNSRIFINIIEPLRLRFTTFYAFKMIIEGMHKHLLESLYTSKIFWSHLKNFGGDLEAE